MALIHRCKFRSNTFLAVLDVVSRKYDVNTKPWTITLTLGHKSTIRTLQQWFSPLPVRIRHSNNVIIAGEDLIMTHLQQNSLWWLVMIFLKMDECKWETSVHHSLVVAVLNSAAVPLSQSDLDAWWCCSVCWLQHSLAGSVLTQRVTLKKKKPITLAILCTSSNLSLFLTFSLSLALSCRYNRIAREWTQKYAMWYLNKHRPNKPAL